MSTNGGFARFPPRVAIDDSLHAVIVAIRASGADRALIADPQGRVLGRVSRDDLLDAIALLLRGHLERMPLDNTLRQALRRASRMPPEQEEEVQPEQEEGLQEEPFPLLEPRRARAPAGSAAVAPQPAPDSGALHTQAVAAVPDAPPAAAEPHPAPVADDRPGAAAPSAEPAAADPPPAAPAAAPLAEPAATDSPPAAPFPLIRPARIDGEDALTRVFFGLASLPWSDSAAEALQKGLQVLTDVVPARGARAALYDIDSHVLRCVAVHGEARHPGGALDPHRGLRRLASACCGTPLRLNGAHLHPLYDPSADGGVDGGARDILYANLEHDEHLLGVLQLFDRVDGARFSVADAEVLEYVATRLSAFVHEAGLAVEARRGPTAAGASAPRPRKSARPAFPVEDEPRGPAIMDIGIGAAGR